jgi:hypothetical protein
MFGSTYGLGGWGGLGGFGRGYLAAGIGYPYYGGYAYGCGYPGWGCGYPYGGYGTLYRPYF